MNPETKVLDELIRRITSAAQPLRIILFGSAARGTLGPNSDLDVLVVMPDDCDCRELTRTFYRRLRGLGHAKDILVVRQRDIEEHGQNPYLILHTALTEGKELYRAAVIDMPGLRRPHAGTPRWPSASGQTLDRP